MTETEKLHCKLFAHRQLLIALLVMKAQESGASTLAPLHECLMQQIATACAELPAEAAQLESVACAELDKIFGLAELEIRASKRHQD